MLVVRHNQKRLVEKNLFCLRLAHSMLIPTFPGIAVIPIEPGNLRPINH